MLPDALARSGPPGKFAPFRVIQDIRFDERDRMVEAWLSMEDQAEFDDFLS